MHKQSTKRRKGNRSKGISNSNYRLPESVAKRIKELFGVLDSEQDFATEYLKSEYLSKFCESIPGSADLRRSAAIEKWRLVDAENANTNQRLLDRDPGYNILPRVSYSAFCRFARRLVRDILGTLEDSIVLGSFSGGASTSRKRVESSSASKFVGQADITSEAICVLPVLFREAPLLREYNTFTSLREVRGAMLFTVPKKSDIDRCACKEPDINMFLQKGVGRYMRRRLLKFGINLNDQSINKRLAEKGSIDNSLATLDLSSASDTVTIELVRALLPTDWFDYLNCIRSREVEVEGTFVTTNMFSSMGNGFTFELESLLFYVLMRTTAYFEGISGIISVYGDDIIIPSGMFDMATWVLEEFGFSTNPDKSFADGPFRESCGGHYHSGVDVTPFYLKKPPSRLTDLIRVTNQLRRWAFADEGRQYTHPWLYDLWSGLRDCIPSNLWGGRDCSLDTQLVTAHPARSRLVRAVERKIESPTGLYLSWHVSNWNRSSNYDEVIVGFSDPSSTTSYCRTRRAKPGATYLQDQFFQELSE